MGVLEVGKADWGLVRGWEVAGDWSLMREWHRPVGDLCFGLLAGCLGSYGVWRDVE